MERVLIFLGLFLVPVRTKELLCNNVLLCKTFYQEKSICNAPYGIHCGYPCNVERCKFKGRKLARCKFWNCTLLGGKLEDVALTKLDINSVISPLIEHTRYIYFNPPNNTNLKVESPSTSKINSAPISLPDNTGLNVIQNDQSIKSNISGTLNDSVSGTLDHPVCQVSNTKVKIDSVVRGVEFLLFESNFSPASVSKVLRNFEKILNPQADPVKEEEHTPSPDTDTTFPTIITTILDPSTDTPSSSPSPSKLTSNATADSSSSNTTHPVAEVVTEAPTFNKSIDISNTEFGDWLYTTYKKDGLPPIEKFYIDMTQFCIRKDKRTKRSVTTTEAPLCYGWPLFVFSLYAALIQVFIMLPFLFLTLKKLIDNALKYVPINRAPRANYHAL